jgi:hypothetical protein
MEAEGIFLILTEEELKPLGDAIGLYIGLYKGVKTTPFPKKTVLNHLQIILTEALRARNAEAIYLSANAELSFKNQKLKESLKKVDDHLQGVMHPKRLVMLDCPWMHKTLSQALEEFK